MKVQIAAKHKIDERRSGFGEPRDLVRVENPSIFLVVRTLEVIHIDRLRLVQLVETIKKTFGRVH